MVVIVATGCLGSSSGLAELQYFLNAVVLADHIGVHRIHRHIVVVDALRIERVLVELEVVALQDLVFVQREGVLDGHVLDVLVGQQMLRLSHILVQVLMLQALALVLDLANELVEHGDVPKLLDLDLEDVLDLAVRLPRIFGV